MQLANSIQANANAVYIGEGELAKTTCQVRISDLIILILVE